MNKRKIVITLIVVIFVASLGGNVYWFGSQWFNKQITNAFNAGVNAVRNSIVEVVERDGVVFIGMPDNRQLKLIKVEE